LDPVVAQSAFSDAGISGIPFISWNLVGAGHHAVTTADTLFLIVDNRALFSFLQSSHNTGGSASGLQTVTALLADETPAGSVNYGGESLPGQPVHDVLGSGDIFFELVVLDAAFDTLMAANTLGDVSQNSNHIFRISSP
jgi:hypothetical protein